jgi:hypothetical protein
VALLLVFAGLPIYQPDLEADTTLQPLALVLSCWLFTTTRQREYFAMSSGERLGLIRSAHPVAGRIWESIDGSYDDVHLNL